MTGERVPAGQTPRRSAVRAVSRPHDLQEREADRAADVVGRGGTVADWSFANVPLTSAPAVQRQEAPKPKSDDEKLKEAALKAGEAALATPQGKALKEQVLADPLVKTVTDAVSTTPGKVAAGTAIVGGVGALAATGKALPFQAPAIPLDRITPGLSAKVTYEGPVNAPTFVGLTLTYKEQVPKSKGASKGDSIAADTARLRAQQEMFRPKAEKDAAKKAEQEMVDAWVRSQMPGLRSGVTIPLPTAPTTEEEKPAVQPAPASPSAAPPARAHVDDALAAPGSPIPGATRRSMEARFGRDFSGVRIHDDTRAAATAATIEAAAFTVGEHIALGRGRSGRGGPTGEHLLAHELAHVVQQGSRGQKLQRKAEPAISSPSDPAEREADEIADRVAAGLPASIAGSDGTAGSSQSAVAIQRQKADGAGHDDDEIEGPEMDGEEDDETAEVQASRDAGPTVAPRGFRGDLSRAGAGQELPASPRRTLEAAFGRPFAQVRLHRGAAAERRAASIGADAFTSGSHVHLGARAPDPSTPAGLRLLAHEMSHVRQQATTGPIGRVVQRSRALYFSTLGHQEYFQFAGPFHSDRGYPAPVRVSSVEELLEDLVKLPRPIENVRLVTHAVPAGIMLPLLRGGAQSLFPADLAVQSQAGLESELVTEHQTDVNSKTFAVTAKDFHVVPQDWVADAYGRVASDPAAKQFLKTRKFPDSVTQGGDLETLMWWILDRELILAERPRPADKGKTKVGPVFPGVPNRAAVAASLQRNAAIYEQRARDHLLARGFPEKGTPEDKRAGAEAAVTDFVGRVRAVAPALIDARAGGTQFNFGNPTQRYGTIQGALERGTFSNNVLFAKVAIPNGMPFEIRGCRIGQNPTWLGLFRDFWGMGAGPTRQRPDVSAPDLRHAFGRHSKTKQTLEWLEGPKKRKIFGGTPEFDAHIVHAK